MARFSVRQWLGHDTSWARVQASPHTHVVCCSLLLWNERRNVSLTGTSANYPEERPDDMDPAEPDGITSAASPHANLHPSAAPPGSVTKGRLQSLEQNLLVLERNYGATHPQVLLHDIAAFRALLLCCFQNIAAF